MGVRSGTYRRRAVAAAAIVLALGASARPADAQVVDCTALRQQIEAPRPGGDGGRLDIALRQQRAEIDRTRVYAEDSGCNGTGFFDDPNSQQCRMLTRRLQQLQASLQRLQDQASAGDPGQDDRRHGLVEQFNAYCAGAGDEARDPGSAETSPNIVPVDPNAPAGAPASKASIAHVFCVRQCDGAYYPLAVDVPADQVDGMDKICKAQCPGAASSAYTAGQDRDIATAAAADGSVYTALPAAYRFRDGVAPGCACRAPHQSWADALAEADAMIEPHKGDVTVTARISAAMAQPVTAPQASPAPSKAAGKKPARAPPMPRPLVVSPPSGAPPSTVPPGSDQAAPNPGQDITRQFRRSVPTL